MRIERANGKQWIACGGRPLIDFPSVRQLFIPDPGYTMCDVDLAGADAQVVAWEADDPILKQMFREKIKVHVENCKVIYGKCNGKHDPNYTKTKIGVHLTNYGGTDKTCAAALGSTVHEAGRFQRTWFGVHPWILNWHKRVQNELNTRKSVSNKYGYRRIYLDRAGHEVFKQALAWVPQSTVAITINKAWDAMEEFARLVEVLLQVHDSLVFQVPTPELEPQLEIVNRCFNSVVIPYDEPLTISAGIATSTQSWAACTERAW